jgi:hypothetical protein
MFFVQLLLMGTQTILINMVLVTHVDHDNVMVRTNLNPNSTMKHNNPSSNVFLKKFKQNFNLTMHETWDEGHKAIVQNCISNYYWTN